MIKLQAVCLLPLCVLFYFNKTDLRVSNSVPVFLISTSVDIRARWHLQETQQ